MLHLRFNTYEQKFLFCANPVAVMHFGALRGSNAAEDCSIIFLTARNQPPMAEIDLKARALFWSAREPLQHDEGAQFKEKDDHDLKPVKRLRGFVQSSRNTHRQSGVRVTSFSDDRIDALLSQSRDAETMQALALGDHPAAGPILRAQDLLPWGSNPVEDNTEDRIAAMISVATLMGPQGPILAPDIRLGLVYMQPHSYYPLHLHDADETYAIVAGQALWTAGDDRRMRGAGDMIHHPSLMPHAFRTGAEGFVALWRWSGI